MKRTRIKHLTEQPIGSKVTIAGWVRSVRDQKSFAFIEVNDGSQLASIQVVAEGPALIIAQELTTGASIIVTGTLAESPGKGQSVEIKAQTIETLGTCPSDEYPLQKKRHSFEFLRTIAHLRPRTNTHGAVARIRSELSYASHRFFHDLGFVQIHTPIISTTDTEGAGEQFLVTTLNLDKLPRDSAGNVNHTRDFFSKPTYLTVSGQLSAESMACALCDVYTFGPTFRAENSNTSRHLAEFWMLEPEMAFCDLSQNMDVAENYIKTVIGHLLDNCSDDMTFFDKFIEKGLLARLQNVIENDFIRLPYTEGIEILKASGQNFTYPVEWGADLQSEHERYLAETHFKRPVFLTDYPASIKAFYMRANPDGKTVAAMDLLVPGIGELIGGSQREERLDILEKKLAEHDLPKDEYWWYLQLRKYGTVPHAGFGVGFERLIQFATGVENIRDTIAFPRYPGHSEF